MVGPFLRGKINRILHLFARFGPGATTLRPFLHKLRGIKIHGEVFIGDDVYLENAHPDCVEIHDGARVGLRSTIVAHARGKGKIIVEKEAYIGPGCIISATSGRTTVIGEGAVIGAGSVVNKSVPPYTFVAGVPAKPIAKTTISLKAGVSLEEWRAGRKPLT